MNKKIIIIMIIMIFIFVSVLGGCNNKDLSREEYFADLLVKGKKFNNDYEDILSKLNANPTYSYTATFYSENLSNFDTEDRLMPEDKNPSENKEWEKINKEITYIKSGNSEYIKVITKKDSPIVSEVWINDDAIVSVKENGVLIENLDSYNPLHYKINFENNISSSALFESAERKWFSKTIKTASHYYVKDIENEEIPYMDSIYASGYGGDLSFDWQNILYIYIKNAGMTLKKDKLLKFELYTETISSHYKDITQVWNNQTVTNWYGSRTNATKTIINFTYPDRKNMIIIPSI